MSLDYSAVKQKLEIVKTQINNLLDYLEANESKLDKRLIDLEIYTQLANISTQVLQSDCQHSIEK